MNVMMIRKLLLIVVVICGISGYSFSQAKKTPVKKSSAKNTVATKAETTIDPLKQSASKERLVEITTDFGTMIARLYDSTPLHRDNFVKLVEQKFYDSLLFHRVIDQFMIQGGDPMSKNASQDVRLGSGSVNGDRIPAEIRANLFHKKGALAAARDDNPAKASSNCQFYIVQGKAMAAPDLENIYNQRVKASNPSFTYSPNQKETYGRLGGTPFLDQSYSVFGEVISGLDVIDKIAKAPKDQSDRPVQDIRMKIRLLN
jgi:cyclophilin family peptidyl-prolyl cis-trans isomerase